MLAEANWLKNDNDDEADSERGRGSPHQQRQQASHHQRCLPLDDICVDEREGHHEGGEDDVHVEHSGTVAVEVIESRPAIVIHVWGHVVGAIHKRQRLVYVAWHRHAVSPDVQSRAIAIRG